MQSKAAMAAIVAALTAVVLSAASHAHHSFAGTYREGDLLTLEGTIVQFQVRNPHSFINFEVVDEKGDTVLWGGEWGSVTALTQSGVDRTTLKPGQRIIVEGAPPRDSNDHKVLVRSVVRPATDKYEEFVWRGRFN
jgi:hypothetical protein